MYRIILFLLAQPTPLSVSKILQHYVRIFDYHLNQKYAYKVYSEEIFTQSMNVMRFFALKIGKHW